MPRKLNCWEYKKCGREPDGANVAALGVCPASVEARTDGLNDGRNGGRVCWVVSGTFCGGRVQGSYAEKLSSCTSCEFYSMVKKEEGKRCIPASEVLRRTAGTSTK